MYLPALFGVVFDKAVNTWGLGEILIAIVAIAAAIGIVVVAVRVFGVTIPDWVVQIFWIVVCAFVAILAIRWVFSL